MGEIRIVGPGKTRGYPYPVCKKRIVGPGRNAYIVIRYARKLLACPWAETAHARR